MGKVLEVSKILWVIGFLWTGAAGSIFAGAPDTPFPQAISHQYPLPAEIKGEGKRVCVDRDDIVYILTSKGMYRLFDNRVGRDMSYRPLANKIPNDITVAHGDLYYLFPDEIVCNRNAGKFVQKLDSVYDVFAVNDRDEILLGKGKELAILRGGKVDKVLWEDGNEIARIYSDGELFYILAKDGAYRFSPGREIEKLKVAAGTRALVKLNGEVVSGGEMGLGAVGSETVTTRLPAVKISALATDGTNLWAGTSEGIWKRNNSGEFSYYASRRWLDRDGVMDVRIDSRGNVWALTESGLNEIEFRSMTLAEKASWYESKIRQRHVRYGFCAELRLKVAGDVTTEEMVDTDNDGTWSNYYMASQAFHFGATHDEKARANAWETFTALERLESINPLKGFPSRTFERSGFKVSDPDRWHAADGGIWDWKAHTSSDEIIAHTFGSSVLYETVAQTSEEKARIASFFTKVLDHIIRNDWYLIDVDGKPTLWARWNPEYVNHFPLSVFDRRLNSAEIIAMLQFGYKITGNETYRKKAYELMEKHGYLENIMSPMGKIGMTDGIIHQGIQMGDDWNHSDDLLGFVCYWVLYKYAFTDELKAKYAEAIRDHWEFEKNERCPLWNFIFSTTKPEGFDVDGALWTLRGFPLDMIDWSVSNSRRHDITRKPANFRGQELEELLPPGERRMTRWNSQPFILDGGSGGQVELAGDEFLLPYWMGRYLKVID